MNAKRLILASAFACACGPAAAGDLESGLVIRGIGAGKTCSVATIFADPDNEIDGRAHNLSVNCTDMTSDKNGYAGFTHGLPHARYCVARIQDVVRKAGAVKTDPVPLNALHCLVNNVRARDLVAVMTQKP